MQLVPSLVIILVERMLQYHSGWIVCNALDQKRFWMTAVFQDGGLTAVLITIMMLELCVQTVSLTYYYTTSKPRNRLSFTTPLSLYIL
jgi:hypothetical protein